MLRCRRTNLDTGVEIRIPAIQIGQPSPVTPLAISTRSLLDALTHIRVSTLELHLGPDQSYLCADTLRVQLAPVMPAEELPLFPSTETLQVIGAPVCLSVTQMHQLGRVTFAAASTTEPATNTAINVVFAPAGIQATGANEYRMALQNISASVPAEMSGMSLMIPATDYAALLKVLPKSGTLTWTLYRRPRATSIESSAPEQRLLCLQGSGLAIWLRILPGLYPDYTPVLQQPDTYVFDTDRRSLLQALKAVRSTAFTNANIVELTFQSSQGDMCSPTWALRLSATRDDTGATTSTLVSGVRCLLKPTGSPSLALLANIEYLMSALSVMTGDTARISLTDSDHNCLIQDSADPGWSYYYRPLHRTK